MLVSTVLLFTLAFLPVMSAAAEDQIGSEADYGRAKIGGMHGAIKWESMLHGDGLEGWKPDDERIWSREGDTVILDAAGLSSSSRLVQGDSTWSHYEFKVQVTLVHAANIQIRFGITEDSREYMIDYLGGWKAMAISTYLRDKRGSVNKLDVVNCVLHPKQEYDLVLAVRGRSVTTYVDGNLINRITLDENPKGAVALGTWGHRAIVRFKDPKIRHYH